MSAVLTLGSSILNYLWSHWRMLLRPGTKGVVRVSFSCRKYIFMTRDARIIEGWSLVSKLQMELVCAVRVPLHVWCYLDVFG